MEGNPQLSVFSLCVTGETKADDSSHKATTEEKQEEDDDYHRSDEQVGPTSLPAPCQLFFLPFGVLPDTRMCCPLYIPDLNMSVPSGSSSQTLCAVRSTFGQ